MKTYQKPLLTVETLVADASLATAFEIISGVEGEIEDD